MTAAACSASRLGSWTARQLNQPARDKSRQSGRPVRYCTDAHRHRVVERRGRRSSAAAAICWSCRTRSTPSRNWRSASTAAPRRRVRWWPSAVSRSPTRRAVWPPRSGRPSAAAPWWSGCAPNTTRCRDRPRVRAQHHRRRRGRRRAGAGRGRRRAGPDGGAAGHPRRGVRRRKSVAAQGRCVRRHRRHGHDASGAGRYRSRAVAGALGSGACATTAANRTPPSRRTWGSTPAMRSRVAQVAIGLLRQQLAPGPDDARHRHRRRQRAQRDPGPRRDALHDARHRIRCRCAQLEDRVGDCFLAGALATGCDYEVSETEPTYAELAPDAWLADVFRDEMQRLGRTPVPAELEASLPLGSTDMGNVTQVDARHPSDRRGGRGRCLGASAGVRGRGDQRERRRRGGGGGDHAGAHSRPAGPDARTNGTRVHRTGRAEVRGSGRGNGSRMNVADGAESWLAATTTTSLRGAGTFTAIPSWAARSLRRRSSSPRSWPMPASNRRCCPAGAG